MIHSNLLIIHQGALGDAVLAFPAVTALRKKFNRIDMLCQGQIGKLAAKLGLADKAYPLEAAYFASLFSESADDKIKDILSGYSAILLFSFSSELENRVNQISGYPCCRIPPRPAAEDKIHVTEFLYKHILNCGLIETGSLENNIFSLPGKQTTATRMPIDTARIIIHPGAGSRRKRWPLAHFLNLAELLINRGLQPQFVCGPAEPDLAAELRNQNRPVHNSDELTDLVDLLGFAGGYIGNDSGVSHLAAYLGLPSVIIFGPADPVRWKPPGSRVQIVRPELDCLPCFEIEPENCTDPRCLTDASPEFIFKSFMGIYEHESG